MPKLLINGTNIHKRLKNKVGDEVKIVGWVDIRRDHGKLIFIDLALGYVRQSPDGGLAQSQRSSRNGEQTRSEWVVGIVGKVNKRPEKMVNKDEPLGEVGVEIIEVRILNEAVTPVLR